MAWWVSEPDEGTDGRAQQGPAPGERRIVAYINSDDYFLPGAFEARRRSA